MIGRKSALLYLVLGCIIAMILFTLTGCRSSPPVTIRNLDLLQPSGRVEVNKGIGIAAEVDNPENLPLAYLWTTSIGGKVVTSGETAPSGTYVAPNVPGTEVITVQVMSGGKILAQKSKQIEVVPAAVAAAPAKTLTPTPAPPAPTLASPSPTRLPATTGTVIIWAGQEYYGTNWRSQAMDFGPPLNLQGRSELAIFVEQATPGTNVRLQLLDVNTPDDARKGVAPKTYPLSGNAQNFNIILSELGSIDISQIRRIAVHYGQEAWQSRLNKDNNAVVKVAQVEIDGTQPPAPTSTVTPVLPTPTLTPRPTPTQTLTPIPVPTSTVTPVLPTPTPTPRPTPTPTAVSPTAPTIPTTVAAPIPPIITSLTPRPEDCNPGSGCIITVLGTWAKERERDGMHLYLLVRPIPQDPNQSYWVQAMPTIDTEGRWSISPVYIGQGGDPAGLPFRLCTVASNKTLTLGQQLGELPAGPNSCINVTRGR